MIVTLFTWVVLLVASVITGSFFLSFSSSERLHTPDWAIVAGFAFLTVYAQTFSLFYHVGLLAFVGMFLLCLFFLIRLLRRGIPFRKIFFKSIHAEHAETGKLAFVVLIVIALAFLTAREPSAYDTALYHAQAIRWIEEYGVVPGLGNLHNRFAYNSSFLCLQALFSFRWLLGQSLHSVNGFFSVFAVCYAVLAQSWKKDALLSDFLKLAALFYLYEQRDQISSPNTDLSALLMVWFIFVKWTELAEQKESDTTPWCVLSILSVYAMTLKLSSALIVLLMFYPLVLLIQRREIRRLLGSLATGIACVLPWMARNVLISGYLIYPMYKLDIFPVDWKMSPSVLDYDSKEISVWGRGVKDVALYEEPLSSWIPVWYGQLPDIYKVIVLTGAVGLALGVISVIVGLVRRSMSYGIACYFLVCMACTLMWFCSSPDIRYGKIFVLLWNAFLLYVTFHRAGRLVLPLLALPALSVLMSAVLVHETGICVQEADYPEFGVTGVEYDSVTFYLPSDTDQAGYEYFPSTPYENRLKQIELRGNDLSDGFRVKEQYRTEHRNAYGEEW